MAANMKAVKLRIKSVESTMQITKAMELVASSKLRKAKERADTCRPYFQELYRTLQEIAKGNTEFYSIYAKEAVQETCCYVLIAGDRGLAGGYNANLLRCFEEDAKGKTISVLPIGKKAVEYVKSRNLECITDAFAEIADISVADCFEIASILCKEFRQGTFGHVELCYTRFFSILTQNPESVPVLPLVDIAKEEAGEKEKIRNRIRYEPDGVEVFNAIVPEYLGGLIYGGVCESVASELAARRNAMEKATGNAQDMIDELNLYYNRERQASITQEITEIVGGAECL